MGDRCSDLLARGAYGLPNQIALGGTAFHRFHLPLELLVRAAQHAQENVPPGHNLVLAFMPALRAFDQDAIVLVPGLLNETFEADVARYLKAVRVEQERRGKPGDAPVPITERMNAQKVEDEGGDNQERRKRSSSHVSR